MHLFGLCTKCVHVFSFKCTLFCIPLHHEAINLMCKELFKRIDSVIRKERLYANVDLMRDMKAKGYAIHDIAEVTGLSEEDIERL